MIRMIGVVESLKKFIRLGKSGKSNKDESKGNPITL